MSLDLLNAEHGVVFELDVHASIPLARDIEKLNVVGKYLLFGLDEFQERTFTFKEDNSVLLVVCVCSFYEASGQQVVALLDGLTAIVSQDFAELVGVESDDPTHEKCNAVENGGVLILAGHGVSALFATLPVRAR